MKRILYKFPLLSAILTLTALLAASVSAEVDLTVSSAVQIQFPTKVGEYYQLQVKEGGEWRNPGVALLGNGKTITHFGEPGTYRVLRPSEEWVMVWADEFQGDDLDYTKWGKEQNNYGGGNHERQAYRTEPKYCFVQDGLLNIAVYRDSHTTTDGKEQPYSSARIRTLKRGDWKYGRFEIRAKMPNGQGIWPAVWMLPTESKYGGWAAGGEIDIIESRGRVVDETTGALHFGGKDVSVRVTFSYNSIDSYPC